MEPTDTSSDAAGVPATPKGPQTKSSRKSVGFSDTTRVTFYWQDPVDHRDIRYQSVDGKLNPAGGVPVGPEEIKRAQQAGKAARKAEEIRKVMEEEAARKKKAMEGVMQAEEAKESKKEEMSSPQTSAGTKRGLPSTDAVESPSKRHKPTTATETQDLPQISDEEVANATAKATTARADASIELATLGPSPPRVRGTKRSIAANEAVESQPKRLQLPQTPALWALPKVSDEEMANAEAKAAAARTDVVAALAALNASRKASSPCAVIGAKRSCQSAVKFKVPTILKRRKMDHRPDGAEVSDKDQHDAETKAAQARDLIRTMLSTLMKPEVTTSQPSPSSPRAAEAVSVGDHPGWPLPRLYQPLQDLPPGRNLLPGRPAAMPKMSPLDRVMKWSNDFGFDMAVLAAWRQSRETMLPLLQDLASQASNVALPVAQRCGAIAMLQNLQFTAFWIEAIEPTDRILGIFWDNTLSREEHFERCRPICNELDVMLQVEDGAVERQMRDVFRGQEDHLARGKLKRRERWYTKTPKTQEDFYLWWRRSDHAYMNRLLDDEREDLMNASLSPNDDHEAQGKTGHLPVSQWLDTLDQAITPKIVARLIETRSPDNDDKVPRIGKIDKFKIEDPDSIEIRISPQDIEPWGFEEIEEEESPRYVAEVASTTATQQTLRAKLLKKLWKAGSGETL